jgi:hypothetical protein
MKAASLKPGGLEFVRSNDCRRAVVDANENEVTGPRWFMSGFGWVQAFAAIWIF